jgi:hypothetical protein
MDRPPSAVRASKASVFKAATPLVPLARNIKAHFSGCGTVQLVSRQYIFGNAIPKDSLCAIVLTRSLTYLIVQQQGPSNEGKQT